MTKMKNDYAIRVEVIDDEMKASRDSNIRLQTRISELTNEKNQLQQRSGVPTNSSINLGSSAAGGYTYLNGTGQPLGNQHRPAAPPGSPPAPPVQPNPFVGYGGNPLALPPQPPRPARSVSENLTATGAKLKDIDIFRGDPGGDASEYKYWRRSAQNFLDKTNVYTTVKDQMDYIVDHLRGPAAQQVEYRASANCRTRFVNVQEIFENLDRTFDTADPLSDATASLYDGTLK